MGRHHTKPASCYAPVSRTFPTDYLTCPTTRQYAFNVACRERDARLESLDRRTGVTMHDDEISDLVDDAALAASINNRNASRLTWHNAFDRALATRVDAFIIRQEVKS